MRRRVVRDRARPRGSRENSGCARGRAADTGGDLIGLRNPWPRCTSAVAAPTISRSHESITHGTARLRARLARQRGRPQIAQRVPPQVQRARGPGPGAQHHGALLGEVTREGVKVRDTIRPATGAAAGRIAGTILKLGFAVAILVQLSISAFI